MNILAWQLYFPPTEQKSQQSLIFSSRVLRPRFSPFRAVTLQRKIRDCSQCTEKTKGFVLTLLSLFSVFQLCVIIYLHYDAIYHTNIWFCFEPLKIIRRKNSTFQILVAKASCDKVLRKYFLSLYRASILLGSLLLLLLPFNWIYQRKTI